MNTLLDEKIILIMKVVTCGTAAIAVLAQIAWKVSDKDKHVKYKMNLSVFSCPQVHKKQYLLSAIPLYIFLGGPEITNKRSEGVLGG